MVFIYWFFSESGMNQKQYETKMDRLEVLFVETVKECHDFLKEHTTVSDELAIEKLQYAIAKIIEENK